MEQTKTYEPPRTEVIAVEPQGIVCVSKINGTGMEFNRQNGEW